MYVAAAFVCVLKSVFVLYSTPTLLAAVCLVGAEPPNIFVVLSRQKMGNVKRGRQILRALSRYSSTHCHTVRYSRKQNVYSVESGRHRVGLDIVDRKAHRRVH